jgi:acyl carrier protein
MKESDAIGVVIDCIREVLLEEYEDDDCPPPQVDPSSVLLGKSGILDSHGLVSAVVLIEEKLADDFGFEEVIADERALSMEKSPFRTVQTLAEYIMQLAEESRVDDET